MVGESNSFTPTVAGSGEKAEFGAVSRAEVEVTQADWAPLAEVVQPAGNAGAVTPSKFWEKTLASAGLAQPKGEGHRSQVRRAVLQLERGGIGATATPGRGKGERLGHRPCHW